MKKILLPTDFSSNADKAIDYAIRLFKSEPCLFYVLHAYHDAPSETATKMSTQKDLDQLVKLLEDQKDNEEHHFEAIIEKESLLNLANRIQIDKDVDYIFMGTRGSSAIREFFFGSNTLDLIRHIDNCPIIAVPEDYELQDIKEIVLATDLKHSFGINELIPLTYLVRLWDANLNVAHIKTEKELNDMQKLNKDLLRASLKGTRHHFFEIKGQESVANTLYDIEKANKNIGLMALLRTKHGFLERITRGSVIKNITLKTTVPLLLLHEIK